MRRWLFILGCVIATALVITAVVWHDSHRATPPAVLIATFTLHDAARGKDVPVFAMIPTAAPGPCPVILFSHGNQSGGPAMAGLFADWAAHGYVCLAPTHDDSVSMRAAAIAAGATTLPAAGMIEPRGAGTDSVLNRARDLSFLIDSLGDVESHLHLHIDRNRIGVGGHSSGAYTAMLVGGMSPLMDGKPRSATDPRPKAFLVLAPIGAGQGGLTRDSWRTFDRPLMNVTGSLDLVPRGQFPDKEKRDPFTRSPAGDKFNVYLVGANHGTFTCDPTDMFYIKQLGGSAEQQAVLFNDIHDITLAYWDAYLSNANTAKSRLRNYAPTTRVTIEYR